MSKLYILVFTILFSLSGFSECVHEKEVRGDTILEALKLKQKVFVQTETTIYKDAKLLSIDPSKKYLIQFNAHSAPDSNLKLKSESYNKKYLEYYSYAHMQKFLKANDTSFKENEYKISVVGKSVRGRELYKVSPLKLDPSKKLIVMFGRHHGDEGTANWIIEGFVRDFFKREDLKEKFQLVLYPMINPDGTEAKSRYNANGRDLNRSWHKTVLKSHDEVFHINKDLQPYLKERKRTPIVLDMHGSFTEDFIYRVKKSFKGEEFFKTQQNFIDKLGNLDLWQKGNFKLSNGHENMARIVLVREYGMNALTHETVKNIPLHNRGGRTILELKRQGEAVSQAIFSLY